MEKYSSSKEKSTEAASEIIVSRYIIYIGYKLHVPEDGKGQGTVD